MFNIFNASWSVVLRRIWGCLSQWKGQHSWTPKHMVKTMKPMTFRHSYSEASGICTQCCQTPHPHSQWPHDSPWCAKRNWAPRDQILLWKALHFLGAETVSTFFLEGNCSNSWLIAASLSQICLKSPSFLFSLHGLENLKYAKLAKTRQKSYILLWFKTGLFAIFPAVFFFQQQG